MLLKAGVAMILFSLALAAVTATVVFLNADSPEDPVLPAEPRAAEVKQAEEREFDPGQMLEIDEVPERYTSEEPAGEPQPEPREPRPEPSPEPTPEEANPADSQTEEPRAEDPRPAAPEIPDWPRPTEEEVASAEEPRYYEATPDTSMSLTIEALGLYDVPVISSYGYETLDRGLMHEPDTSFPWDGGAQRNVYIAGHYLGYPGTASHLVFYNLDRLKDGDEIVLEDSGGNDYTYRVGESFVAGPEDSWVMGQVYGRDMLTLQTCVPPTFEERLVVRADRA